MRAPVVLPDELIAEVDQIVGKRKRSQFIEDAVRRRLASLHQYRALQEIKRLPKPDPPPWWSTPEKTTAWVRALRDNDEEKLRELGWPGDADD